MAKSKVLVISFDNNAQKLAELRLMEAGIGVHTARGVEGVDFWSYDVIVVALCGWDRERDLALARQVKEAKSKASVILWGSGSDWWEASLRELHLPLIKKYDGPALAAQVLQELTAAWDRGEPPLWEDLNGP